MRPRPSPTNLLITPLLLATSAAAAISSRATAPTRALCHEVRDEPRNGHLTDLRRSSRAPAPLPNYIVLLAAAAAGLLRCSGPSAPPFLRGSTRADACAIEIALPLELGEVGVKRECAVRCMSRERDLCWRAEAQTAKKQAQVHC